MYNYVKVYSIYLWPFLVRFINLVAGLYSRIGHLSDYLSLSYALSTCLLHEMQYLWTRYSSIWFLVSVVCFMNLFASLNSTTVLLLVTGFNIWILWMVWMVWMIAGRDNRKKIKQSRHFLQYTQSPAKTLNVAFLLVLSISISSLVNAAVWLVKINSESFNFGKKIGA